MSFFFSLVQGTCNLYAYLSTYETAREAQTETCELCTGPIFLYLIPPFFGLETCWSQKIVDTVYSMRAVSFMQGYDGYDPEWIKGGVSQARHSSYDLHEMSDCEVRVQAMRDNLSGD